MRIDNVRKIFQGAAALAIQSPRVRARFGKLEIVKRLAENARAGWGGGPIEKLVKEALRQKGHSEEGGLRAVVDVATAISIVGELKFVAAIITGRDYRHGENLLYLAALYNELSWRLPPEDWRGKGEVLKEVVRGLTPVETGVVLRKVSAQLLEEALDSEVNQALIKKGQVLPLHNLAELLSPVAWPLFPRSLEDIREVLGFFSAAPLPAKYKGFFLKVIYGNLYARAVAGVFAADFSAADKRAVLDGASGDARSIPAA
jgi:hypothetical protein